MPPRCQDEAPSVEATIWHKDTAETEDGYCCAKTARIAVLIEDANDAGTSGVGSWRHTASVRFSDSQARRQ